VKAIVVRRFGGPEVLEYLDWPEPQAAPGEVLIRVHAVTVGRTLDVEVRKRGADLHATLPLILGSDPAGVVEAVGDGVADFAPGDRVVSTSSTFCGECDYCRAGLTNACEQHGAIGVQRDGGYAEYVSVPVGTLAHIPDHVTMEQAACMGVSYPVAWNLLTGAHEGQDVLVMGAGGGLGIAGILIARALGARAIAAAGSDWKLERCRDLLGAAGTVNYGESGWAERVRELSRDGRGVDVVYENISSPELFDDALSTLRRYGRLVTCGAHGGGAVTVDMRRLYRSHLTIAGDTGATSDQIREVFGLVAERKLEPPPVFHRFPLEDAAAAQEAAAGRELFGRAVLVVREEQK
jgi:NADPH:quinone reductase-like Zn-dependent oxidoreductase